MKISNFCRVKQQKNSVEFPYTSLSNSLSVRQHRGCVQLKVRMSVEDTAGPSGDPSQN
jgi:hypothetical protein